jgi:hypothetical protein
MAMPDYASTLATLREQQASHPLSILSLAEPIITAAQSSSPSTRKSNVSDTSANSDLADPTPATLRADLAHYRALFSKLRFSYLEQVTKEKYLRAIVGDPPLLVGHADNVALEEKLSAVKAELKGKKDDVGRLVDAMDERARSLAARWEGVQAQMARLEALPPRVHRLEETVAQLRRQLVEREGGAAKEPGGDGDDSPRMHLGRDETERLVAEQRERARELDREIAAMQAALPAKMRQCERMEAELDGLERRRNDVAAAAAEARRVKEQGGRDELEDKARWYTSAEVVLKALVAVDA